jgi:hypothetical protein
MKTRHACVILLFLLFLGAIVLATDPPGTFPLLFNPRVYGAYGGGSAGTGNEYNQLNKAVVAMTSYTRGKLQLDPFGVYVIGHPIQIDSKADFEIDGQNATIRSSNSLTITDDTGLGDTLSISRCSNFVLRNIDFDGNASNRGHSDKPVTLRLSGCSNFKIINCRFRNVVGDAVYVSAYTPLDDSTATHDGMIERCRIEDAYRNGLSIIHAHDLVVQACVIRGVTGIAPQSGIDIEANSTGSNTDSDNANYNITIDGCRIEDCVKDALHAPGVQHPKFVFVTNNLVQRCENGIDFPDDTCSDNRVTGNQVRSMTQIGILMGGQRSVIAENVISNAGSWAMYVSGGLHVVSNNTFIDSPTNDRSLVLNSHGGTGTSIIRGNVFRKTTLDSAHVALSANGDDVKINNYCYNYDINGLIP